MTDVSREGQFTPSFSEYGGAFQEKIVQALLADHKWAEQMSEVLKTEYFDLKYLKYLSDYYFKYYGKYKSFPTLQLLVSIIRDDLKTGVDTLLRDKIVDFLQRTKSGIDLGDLQYVKEKSLDFCKKQAMREALIQAVDMIESGNDESVLDVIKTALSAGASPDIGHDLITDIESRFIRSSRFPCPTGIDKLDNYNILQGGLGRGELGVIVSSTGGGKSHFLVQVGANAILNGMNVIHYTLELTESAIGRRYDSYICNIDSNDVFERKDEIIKIYGDLKESMGSLIIKEYPTGGASVQTIRSHLDRLFLRNFIPNLIIIDYADIMRSSRKYDSLRFELKLIYEELRNLSSEKSIPIWTASQANRESAQSDVVGLENMSEAYGKAMVADVVLSLSRKAYEKADGFGRLFIAKNRAGRDGIIFPVHIDTARSRIRIIDDASAETLPTERSMKDLLKRKWSEISKNSGSPVT